MRIGCMECGAIWHTRFPVMTCPECGAGETFVDDGHDRGIADLFDQVQANDHGAALSVSFEADAITASAESRTLGGTLVRYGVPGRTSRGMLRVRPGALRFPPDLRRTILTREHDRDASRGVLAAVHDTAERMRVTLRAADGPDGDAALQEAQDGSRAGLSFDVVDATVVGDEITDALVIAIGQVGIPAYDDGRIDTIAASINPGEPMTEEQRRRLSELRAMSTRTAEQEAELTQLTNLALDQATQPQPEPAPEPAPAPTPDPAPAPTPTGDQQVTASVPAVPGGAPGPTTTTPVGGALQEFCEGLAQQFNRASSAEGRALAITAALQDVTYSAHGDVVNQPAWSGELWSGLQYQPMWSDLFNSGNLTGLKGLGWRFTSKLAMQDYAGDKAEIPTDNVTTEQSGYTAARAAVGVDIDRAYFDLGEANAAFIRGLVEQIRESWTMLLDSKVRAYVLAQAEAAKAVESAGPASAALDPQNALLKAAAAGVRSLKRRRVGQASWVYVNDDDLFTLMDVAAKDVSAFLQLFGVNPENFRSDESVPQGTVLAGVKPSATVRQLPGFPVIIDAQNLAKGGVDKAAFGYWAIEEHHARGITSVDFDPTFVPA